LADVRAGKITIVVVYKVDRLTRSLADFAKLVELFDEHGVSFVSITQSFNTTSSMGRLILNVLLSFAQFEREVIGRSRYNWRCSCRSRRPNNRLSLYRREPRTPIRPR
jgi:DNA invertase Pin-like site-specific DNA recombinase